jgi:hypothetical protein
VHALLAANRRRQGSARPRVASEMEKKMLIFSEIVV